MRLSYLLLLACVACSQKNDVDGGVDASPPDGGPWACPASPPRSGTPCPPPLSCEYPTKSGCGSYFQCAGTNAFDYRWGLRARQCGSASACVGVEAGTSCKGTEGSCTSDKESCSCTWCMNDAGDSVLTWACTPFGAAAGCPSTSPTFGSPCAQEGLVCDYRDCTKGYGGTGPPARCLAGLWIADDNIQCVPSNNTRCQ